MAMRPKNFWNPKAGDGYVARSIYHPEKHEDHIRRTGKRVSANDAKAMRPMKSMLPTSPEILKRIALFSDPDFNHPPWLDA